MSSKLDQSLEEIAGSRRNNNNNNNRRARRPGKAAAKPQVAGGVSKKTATKPAAKAAKASKAAPAAPQLPTTGESKIIVSNLPSDVTEQQLKDYFAKTIGAVKKVFLNYNKTGRSVGVANIVFQKPESAANAAQQYDGVKVDGKPMKIEVILGAKYAPVPVAPKGLGDRIQGPKKDTAKPKSAAPKAATAAANGKAGAAGAKKGRKAARPNRPKPKTVEELDAEMNDYFVPIGEAAAPAATTGGDAAMAVDIVE